MTPRPFVLQPFPGTPAPPVHLGGRLARSHNGLDLTFVLAGELTALSLPAPAQTPQRRHGLWQETCLEFFLAPEGAPGYWEVNLSPAGHWNVYRFMGYRQGMAEETAFASLPFQVRRGAGRVEVGLRFPLAALVPADRVLAVGLSAVLKRVTGDMTYWALAHPGPEPDFHHRDGFILHL